MIEAKKIFSGQKSRYGDYFHEYEIKTDCLADDVVEWCFKNLIHKRFPERQTWLKEQKNPDGSTNYSYYFGGYYTIKPIKDGFCFTICLPYAD